MRSFVTILLGAVIMVVLTGECLLRINCIGTHVPLMVAPALHAYALRLQ
ncbi:MAG TPA: hypothetical protein VKI99_16235 [Candidatus Dormibacteraeota bacterium]|nr:hypothetical protein [Candidatus Dormibacteraeota bacterium]